MSQIHIAPVGVHSAGYSRHQVIRRAQEGNIPPIRTHHRIGSIAIAGADPISSHADEGVGAGLKIAAKHVPVGINLAHDQVGGRTEEDHVTAVRADERVVRGATPGRTAVESDARQDGGATHQVPHENVRQLVRVVQDQIIRRTGEGHPPAIRADRQLRQPAGPVARLWNHRRISLGNHSRVSRDEVPHEHIRGAIFVQAEQPAIRTAEGDEPPIRTQA